MFWSLTLTLFLRLVERHRAEERRADHRAGVLAAAMYNVQRVKRTDHFFEWTEFFPEHTPPRPLQTDEEMLGAMMLWAKRRPDPGAN